jgi:hypothetical protein
MINVFCIISKIPRLLQSTGKAVQRGKSSARIPMPPLAGDQRHFPLAPKAPQNLNYTDPDTRCRSPEKGFRKHHAIIAYFASGIERHT